MQTLPPRVKAALWRATELPCNGHPTVPTGHAALDAALPGGGWPTHSLTEILSPQAAVLEWRLLGPAWRRLASRRRPLVWIAPPQCPHLPGLQHAGVTADQLIWVQAQTAAERLWAAEQVIKSNDFGALMVWLPQARAEQLRRLQLCAQAVEGLVFAWRPAVAQWTPSAAPLRALVTAGADWDLQVHLFKRQGPAHEVPLSLPCVPGPLSTLMTPRLAHPSALFTAASSSSSSSSSSTLSPETSHVVDRPVLDPSWLDRACAAAH
ncbi:MAG: translesion DNA synthesis-associated protein ImuA [Pseudomonadota bacterium]